MTIAERVCAIRERMAAAAIRSGRSADDVVLVGVTKNHPAEAAAEVLAAGVLNLGENRIQEGVPKFDALSQSGICFRKHLIGHLQTNKAKIAAKSFDCIHSVESTKLALALEHAAETRTNALDVLLEVNVSGEASKFGLTPEQVPALAEFVMTQCPHLHACGLMTMAPLEVDAEETRPVFAGLRKLSQEIQEKFPGFGAELSMGMTNDFEVAIEEGATMIRVGTALFVN